ncbi:MAG: nucleotidyltransferase domain-containing protein [Desulfobacterales bacterium]|nr:nucleotidyltransferase domain-containing protein [Desulfobacterales bacterium]
MQEITKIVLDLSEKVAEILKEHFEDRLISVCLFGSATRGTLHRGSDIDFLVVKRDSNQTYHKRVKRIVPLLYEISETEEYQRVERLNFYLEPSFLIVFFNTPLLAAGLPLSSLSPGGRGLG